MEVIAIEKKWADLGSQANCIRFQSSSLIPSNEISEYEKVYSRRAHIVYCDLLINIDGNGEITRVTSKRSFPIAF